MSTSSRFQQAYAQAPWRLQLQLSGAFILALIAAWMIAAMYLDVSTRAAAIGRQIQEMQVSSRSLSVNSAQSAGAESDPLSDTLSIEELRLINENLQTQLAYLSSDALMVDRATKMGFKPVAADELLYLQVAGYLPRQTAQLAPPPGPAVGEMGNGEWEVGGDPYRRQAPQAMLEWLRDEILRALELVREAQP